MSVREKKKKEPKKGDMKVPSQSPQTSRNVKFKIKDVVPGSFL